MRNLDLWSVHTVRFFSDCVCNSSCYNKCVVQDSMEVSTLCDFDNITNYYVAYYKQTKNRRSNQKKSHCVNKPLVIKCKFYYQTYEKRIDDVAGNIHISVHRLNRRVYFNTSPVLYKNIRVFQISCVTLIRLNTQMLILST